MGKSEIWQHCVVVNKPQMLIESSYFLKQVQQAVKESRIKRVSYAIVNRIGYETKRCG